jgi:hypothetical protein
MRDNHAVNRSGRRNRNIIHDLVDWVAQKFETGSKGYIKLAPGQFIAQGRWVVEIHIAWPPSNQRLRVEIFDAADAKGFQIE